MSKHAGENPSSRLLKERGVLSPRYIPPTPLHRDRQIMELLESFQYCDSGQPRNTLMIGPVGTGKTLVARHVISQFGSDRAGFKVIYLNCQRAQTGYRLFHQLLKELGYSVPPTGFPEDWVYSNLIRRLDQHRFKLVICLDELDRVAKRDPEALSRLTRLNEQLSYQELELVGISNQLDFVRKLDPGTRSRLVQHQILFPPYNQDQLFDILIQRAKLGLVEGGFDPEAIQYCAELAARDGGDAREAIDLLRESVDLAQNLGASKLTKDHVETAWGKLKLGDYLTILDSDQKSVLMSIIDLEEASLEECYLRYRKLVSDQISLERFKKIVIELDRLGILSYRPKSRKLSLELPAHLIRKFILRGSSI